MPGRLLQTFRVAVFVALLLPGLYAQAAGHAVILQYHHIGDDTPPSTSVTRAQFDRHLDYLSKNAYHVWPLKKVVAHLARGADIPEKVVAVTFDDAHISVYREAWPRMRVQGMPFTVFVSTAAVDRGDSSRMSWDQMREMARDGITLANHSHSHAHLIRRSAGERESAWYQRVRTDVLQAQRRLEEELGEAPRLFAYPYGEYDAALRALIGALGFTAFGQHSGPVGADTDHLTLPRFAMAQPYAALEEFAVKLETRPFPVRRAAPEDPLLPIDETRPRLQVSLGPGDYVKESLTCYVSGQGRVEPDWADPEKRVFELRAPRPLPVGRSRYNCTAHEKGGRRYFWYSHLWIRRNPDGSWYRE